MEKITTSRRRSETNESQEDVQILAMKPQADLPPGPTWQCTGCGTRLRRGQPHSAQSPYPHFAYNALISHQ